VARCVPLVELFQVMPLSRRQHKHRRLGSQLRPASRDRERIPRHEHPLARPGRITQEFVKRHPARLQTADAPPARLATMARRITHRASRGEQGSDRSRAEVTSHVAIVSRFASQPSGPHASI
jgi:hypothetical protein